MGNDANKKGLAAGIAVTILSIVGLFFTDGTLNIALQVMAGLAGAVSLFFGYNITKIDPVEFEAVQQAVAQQETHNVAEAIQEELVADDYYLVIKREFTDF